KPPSSNLPTPTKPALAPTNSRAGKRTAMGAAGSLTETIEPFQIQRRAVSSTDIPSYMSYNQANDLGGVGVKNLPAANSAGAKISPAASSAEAPSAPAASSAGAQTAPAASEKPLEKGKGKAKQRLLVEEIPDPQSPQSTPQTGKTLQPIIRHIDDLEDMGIAVPAPFSSDMPESVSIAMYKGSAKSRTPSLASLIPPSAACSEVPTESNEGSMSEYPSMWKNIPRGITVIMFDEPLHASVELYHQHYNPQRADDPLLQYGAVDVIRWTQPHMDLVWETLPLAVADFKDHQVFLENISEYVCDDVHMYGLEVPELDKAAHIVLAIEQIFVALAQFAQDDRKAVFRLDPKFGFIRLLAWHHSAEEIRVTHAVLRKRTSVAVKHIQRLLNSIQTLFTDSLEVDSVSSYDSSLPHIRNTFGNDSPRVEALRLAARPESGEKNLRFISLTNAQKPPVLSSLTKRHPISALPGVGKVIEVVPAKATKTPELSKNKETGGPSWTCLKEAAQWAVNPKTTRTDNSTKNEQQGWAKFFSGKSKFPPRPRNTPSDDGTSLKHSNSGSSNSSQPRHSGSNGGGDDEGGSNGSGGNEGGGGGGGNGGGPGGNGGRDRGGGGDGNNGNGGEFCTAHDAAANNYVEEQWQVSHKINATSIPSWDGGGDTIIEYISAMARFARLEMVWKSIELVGRLPTGAQDYLATNWQVMLVGLRYQFLDAEWLKDRTKEFEEMQFRQFGHRKEWPIDFIQRRIQLSSILYPEQDDGPTVVDRILWTIPSEWVQTLNSMDCPEVFELLTKVSRLGKSLVSLWELMEAMRERVMNPTPYRNNRCSFQARGNAPKREAHIAQAPPDGEPESVDGESISSISEESKDQEAHLVQGRPRGGSSRSSAAKSKKPWPKGKTVDGYTFSRDDSVKSVKQPNGSCYICTSPFHFANDCLHHGRWRVMRDANMIYVELDPEEEAACDREYLAMLAEIDVSSSAYLSDSAECLTSESEAEEELLAKEVFTVDARATGAFALHARSIFVENCNTRHRQMFEAKRKGKEALKTSPHVLPRKICRKGKGEVVEEMSESADSSAAYVFSAETGSAANTSKSVPMVVPTTKVRSYPEGYGSLGARALHMKVHIGSLDTSSFQGQLDSGADITLMSEDYWKTMTEEGI
ncbi:hypothetical protein DXG01_002407, partial [Tephrocybe rancida]